MATAKIPASRPAAGRFTKIACLAVFCVALAACAGGGKRGVAPNCPEPAKGSTDYVIGAGDALEIFV